MGLVGEPTKPHNQVDLSQFYMCWSFGLFQQNALNLG